MGEGESHTSICCAANRLISMMRFVEKQAFWQEARRLSCINGKGLIRKRTVVFAISTLLALSLSGCAASELNSDNSAEPQVNTSQSTPQSSQQKPQLSQAAGEPYKVFWADDALGPFGGTDSQAELGELSVVQKHSGEYCLVLQMTYQNSSDIGTSLMNDNDCSIVAYQGGIELKSPGVTSESGIYDYNDALTRVGDGASVSTELAWVLRDTETPVELDFGKDAHHKPLFSKDVSIEKSE